MPAWAMSIVSHWGFKAAVAVVLLGGVLGGAWLYHRNGYNSGYRIGYAQSLKDNPPNVYNGPSTINQQPCNVSTLGLTLGHVSFGFTYRK